ncbi:MAG TPA: hypothetical protein VKF62_06220 [Planctomycetota bacterium]|nr:hypothetical protein [Planctomycetota bacterium]
MRLPLNVRSRRIASLCALLMPVVPQPAAAQCTSLGTPGQAGCGPLGFAPFVTCSICAGPPSGTPNVGNPVFTLEVYYSGAFFVSGTTPLLLLGPCAPIPYPVPSGACGPPPIGCICPATLGGCTAFVDLPQGSFPGIGPYTGPSCGLHWFWTIPIPNDPFLIGGSACAQVVGRAPTSPGMSCLAVSQGLQVTILP